MYRKQLLASLTGLAAILLLVSGVSQAKDYCLTDAGVPAYILVGRGFKIPAKGQCKAWIGFTAQSGENSPTTGTGCTSSDGSYLDLTLATSFPDEGYIEFDSISLSLPSQTGTSNYNWLDFGTDGNSFSISGAPCSGIAIPGAP